MSAHWICRLCIAQFGLKGADVKNWPLENDVEGIRTHMREKHHLELIYAEYVDWSTDKCDCEDCQKTRALRNLLTAMGVFGPVSVTAMPEKPA